jgi:hypothetical protein
VAKKEKEIFWFSREVERLFFTSQLFSIDFSDFLVILSVDKGGWLFSPPFSCCHFASYRSLKIDFSPFLKGEVRRTGGFFKFLFFYFAFGESLSFFGVLRPQTPDPLLSASNKSGQKCLSAHFAISNNTSLRFGISEIRSWAENLKGLDFLH